MDLEIINKVDKFLELLDRSDIISNIEKLKEEIYQNNDLNNLIEKYRSIDKSYYNLEAVEIKRKISEQEQIIQFRKNELLLNEIISYLNRRLYSLINNNRECDNK